MVVLWDSGRNRAGKQLAHYFRASKNNAKALRLSTVRTACNRPQRRSSCEAESESGLSAESSKLRFVGRMKINVNGMTTPISKAPTSEIKPPRASQAAIPETKEIAARCLHDGCTLVTRAEFGKSHGNAARHPGGMFHQIYIERGAGK